MPMNLLIDHSSGLAGPREEANFHYPLTNVLVIAVAAKEYFGDQRFRYGSLDHESQTEAKHGAFGEYHDRLVRRRVFLSTGAVELPALSK